MNLLTRLANVAEAQVGLRKIDDMDFKVLVQYEKGEGINPFTKETLKGDGTFYTDMYHLNITDLSKEMIVICSKYEASVIMTGKDFEEILKGEK